MQMVATSSKQSRGWMCHRSMPLRLLQSKGRKRSKMDTRVKPSPLGVRIYNHTFASMPSIVELQDCSVQRCEIPEDWRRDFWGTQERFAKRKNETQTCAGFWCRSSQAWTKAQPQTETQSNQERSLGQKIAASRWLLLIFFYNQFRRFLGIKKKTKGAPLGFPQVPRKSTPSSKLFAL